jgi:class 3 adenylate cyclase
MVCGQCASEQPDGARFCNSCGAPLARPACSGCGADLVPAAKFCNECGAPQAAAAPVSPSGPVSARRVTSVLFGDLVGFTALSERRDQEETRELLSRYFDECRRIIARYGGTVEKFIGDAVMAVWGVPSAHEDDAERAVRAGLELVDAVEALGQEIGVPDLAMRVGIVTGEVAVTLGAQQQGMVAGDAVNTASRVQSVATPGQVWVDETTRLLTSSAITYLDVGSHLLKGKADPMPLWSVHAVVAGVGGVQRADGLEAPLVGRDRELRLVKELFHATTESRQPSLLVMVGEPGLGKSRLGWEFDKYVDGLTMTTRWHNGRCVAYGEGMAYFALSEAVRARLRTLSPEAEGDETAGELAELLERGLARYVPDDSEREWLRPRLGALLGVGSTGSFQREDLFSAWAAFLQRVGEDEHPVVLMIDDAHHADDGLVQFIEHLLATAAFPCFVLLLGRPALLERHPSLATNRRATVSHLAVLADDDVARLLDGLVVGLPGPARRSLVSRSEGVPLFAVETVRSLIDRDLVVPRGGQYVLADAAALDLDSIGAPASLQALISARLDALDPHQRRLVERASVVGNAFSRNEIADLCPDLPDLDDLLAGLVRQQILSQMTSRFSAEFGHYQFVQSVVRQVAYGSLARRERRSIHLAVARQGEEQDDVSGELAPLIAQHYLDAVAAMPDEPDVAELEEKAIAHLERAAARARSLGAVRESAGHLLQALDRARDDATRARLDGAVAWALVDAGDYEAALPHARAAVEAGDLADDPVAAAMASAAQAAALTMTGDYAGALALAEPRWDALWAEPPEGSDRALLALAAAMTTALGSTGQEDRNREVCDKRIQIAERVGDREELANALRTLSVSYSLAIGAVETSRILMTAAADIAREDHYPHVLAGCLLNLTVDGYNEDAVAAVETGREAVEVAERAGVAIWLDYAQANLWLAMLVAGRWEELDAELLAAETDQVRTSIVRRVVTAAVRGSLAAVRDEHLEDPWAGAGPPETDGPSDIAWLGFSAAALEHARGRDDLALRHAVEAVRTMHEQSGVWDDFVHIWPVAMDLAVACADLDTARGLLAIVEQDARRRRVPLGVRAHRALFTALLSEEDAQSDPAAIEPLLRSAIDGYTRWGAPHYRARALGELGRWLDRHERGEEAGPLLREAREALEQLGARAWLRRLEDRQSVPQ